MTCQELVELVTEALDGALDEPARREFDAHVAGCVACTRYVAQMRMTARIVEDIKWLEPYSDAAGPENAVLHRRAHASGASGEHEGAWRDGRTCRRRTV